MEGGECDGKRPEHDEECLDPQPAGSDLLRGGGDRRGGGGPLQPRAVSFGGQRDARGDDRRFLEVSGYIQAALLGRALGHPVRAVREGRLEPAVPRRLSLCPGSATRAVPVLLADQRRGILRIAPRADVYSLSSAGESALRDSHRPRRQGHHRTKALTALHARLRIIRSDNLVAGGGRGAGGCPGPVPSGASRATNIPDWELLP